MANQVLVGGLVAIFGIFPYIGLLIIPIDELIFFRGVAQPPTRLIGIHGGLIFFEVSSSYNHPRSTILGEWPFRIPEAVVPIHPGAKLQWNFGHFTLGPKGMWTNRLHIWEPFFGAVLLAWSLVTSLLADILSLEGANLLVARSNWPHLQPQKTWTCWEPQNFFHHLVVN